MREIILERSFAGSGSKHARFENEFAAVSSTPQLLDLPFGSVTVVNVLKDATVLYVARCTEETQQTEHLLLLHAAPTGRNNVKVRAF